MDNLANAIRAKDVDALMAHYAPDVLTFDLLPPLQAHYVIYATLFDAVKFCSTLVDNFPDSPDIKTAPPALNTITFADGGDAYFPREILLGGEPRHMLKVVDDYSRWMAASNTPKLFINGDPGAVITGNLHDYCRTWKNQEEVTVRGRHHLKEDSPREIAQALVSWLACLENRKSQPMANS